MKPRSAPVLRSFIMEGNEVSSKLINACMKQDRRAQNALYRLLYSRMMNICKRYTRNEEEAREFFVQGFLKILNNLDKRILAVPFEAWASKVMINTVIDAWRKEQRFKEYHEFTEMNETDLQNEQELNDFEKKINRDQALSMLRSLPEATRQVFTLFAIDEYTHREIGELLNISPNTSKWHVSEARKKLLQDLRSAPKMMIA